MHSVERDPQVGLVNAAGVDRQFRSILRDVAQEFPARRGAILLQPRRPVPNLARLQIETAVVPTADHAAVFGDRTVDGPQRVRVWLGSMDKFRCAGWTSSPPQTLEDAWSRLARRRRPSRNTLRAVV